MLCKSLILLDFPQKYKKSEITKLSLKIKLKKTTVTMKLIK